MMMHCIGWGASMRAEHSCASRAAGSEAKIRCWWDAIGPPVAWAAVRSEAVVLLLLTFCLLLLPLWEYVVVLCFVVPYFVPVLMLWSSWCGGEG